MGLEPTTSTLRVRRGILKCVSQHIDGMYMQCQPYGIQIYTWVTLFICVLQATQFNCLLVTVFVTYFIGQLVCANRGWDGCVYNYTVDRLQSDFHLSSHRIAQSQVKAVKTPNYNDNKCMQWSVTTFTAHFMFDRLSQRNTTFAFIEKYQHFSKTQKQ